MSAVLYDDVYITIRICGKITDAAKARMRQLFFCGKRLS